MKDVLLHLHYGCVPNNYVAELRCLDLLYNSRRECSLIPKSVTVSDLSELITHYGNTCLAENTALNTFLSLNTYVRVNIIDSPISLSNLIVLQFLRWYLAKVWDLIQSITFSELVVARHAMVSSSLNINWKQVHPDATQLWCQNQ